MAIPVAAGYTDARRDEREPDMRNVTITEARATWSSLLNAATRGERIIITRYGIPVAMLIPPAEQYPERNAVGDGPETSAHSGE